MKVYELIELLKKAPMDADVFTAYDSMCCVQEIVDERVWLGNYPDTWYYDEDGKPENKIVVICAVSADIDIHEDYKDAVLLSTGERPAEEIDVQ